MAAAAPQAHLVATTVGTSGHMGQRSKALQHPVLPQAAIATHQPPRFDITQQPEKKNNKTQTSTAATGRPLSFGVYLFPGYEPLDVMGPLQILFRLSMKKPIKLSIISDKRGPVSAQPDTPDLKDQILAAPQMLATHTFTEAPEIDVLLVPGGWGMMLLMDKNNTSIENFIKERYPKLQYLLSVCTGAIALAKSGVLKGKQATTNKSGYDHIAGMYSDGINWVPNARWTEDDKIWTSSGVAAGIDMTYAFFNKMYGPAVMKEVMNAMEYAPHSNSKYDPFASVFKVRGAVESHTDECPKPL
ncbi:hypothetical protein AA313_de0203257 [Arthrobotrys entomopaga]|nr:hypothetical protein AA313_de0203257 [Arthrobotrys entomopaga]